MNDTYEYPLPGFHFQVDFLFEAKDSKDNFLGPQSSSFQEISGLKASMELESYQEFGFLGQPRGLIAGRRFDNLILKRGVTKSAKLSKWFEDALYYRQSKHISVLVLLLNTEGDQRGKPVAGWQLYEAYPISLEYSGFDSMNSGFLIETLELHYSYFVSLEIKSKPPAKKKTQPAKKTKTK